MTISIRSAVERLIDAPSRGRPLAPLSETDGEFSLEQAYATQDALRAELARRGHKSIGWKLGATSPSGQAVMGVKEPAFLEQCQPLPRNLDTDNLRQPG